MFESLRNAWAQALSFLLGLWLMAAPAVLGYADATTASAVHRIVGPVAAGFGLNAIWGHMRPVRWVNVPLGLVLVGAPLLLSYGLLGAVNSVVVGLLIAGLALVRGRIPETYGGGWSTLWTGDLVEGGRADRGDDGG